MTDPDLLAKKLAFIETCLTQLRELAHFALLAGARWIDATLALELRRAAAFRNVVVHGYTAVDPAVITDVVENHLGDLAGFVAAVRAKAGP